MEEAFRAAGVEKQEETSASRASSRKSSGKPQKNIAKKPNRSKSRRPKKRKVYPDNSSTVNPWAEGRVKSPRPPQGKPANGYIVIGPNTRVNPGLCHDFDTKCIRADISGTFKDQNAEGPNPAMFTEMVLGLDFGTANTKVVVMEQGSQAAWAVPFTKDVNPYLIPSCVYKNEDEYTLLASGQKLTDLKLPLLLDEKIESGHLDHIVAFLALVIRYSRDWFFKEHGDIFPDTEFEWNYHIGLPASNFRDGKLVRRFKTLIAAAAELSLNQSDSISDIAVKSSVVSAHKAVTAEDRSDPRCEPQFTRVFPEIAAQLHGYVRSDRWDRNRPKFMLVDVGAGTVDACILNVTESSEGEIRYSFLKSSVQKQGVVMLHLARIDWIAECIARSAVTRTDLLDDLQKLSFSRDCTQPLPQSIADYLENAEFPDTPNNADKAFYNAYGKALWDGVISPVKTTIDPTLEQWKSLPFILCGGGSQHSLYRRFIQVINRGNSGSTLRLAPVRLRKPENLRCPGCPAEDYHRLSVAFGLAHWELGEIFVEDDVEIYPRPTRDHPPMIGPEHV
ncbi:MAG: hypothetical protein ACJAST_002491 [Halopseudomonas sp.]|jgi:hypothetical protein|tara:strand:- start:370 stop:2052 length:1683 start_codon:yes stop_codon:yes gene_type:complete